MSDPQRPASMAAPDSASVALRRFGLGARPDDRAKITGDPRGYLLAQLSDPSKLAIDDAELDPSHESFRHALLLGQQQRLARQITREGALDAAQKRADQASKGVQGDTLKRPGNIGDNAAQTPSTDKAMPAQKRGQFLRETYREEAEARIAHMIASDTPFLERWALFWSNHFCVSAQKGNVRVLVGGYEREAIRPRILGKFVDLLKAVEMHPAMLIYLDNQQSFGPNSPAGRNQKRGLNENLAREILELHTLGVDGGYAQADVTAFASVLTGWTVGQLAMPNAVAGMFHYIPQRREPGSAIVLGTRYSSDEGARAGARVLEQLAQHPSTARAIARKLARHFVSDTPQPALTAALEKSFRDTDGDLTALAKTLLGHEVVWTAPLVKSVPPLDYQVSLARGIVPKIAPREILRNCAALGQPVWSVPSPKGWPDEDAAWAGPSAMRERLRLSEQLTRLVDRAVDPRTLARSLLGEASSGPTLQSIGRAETREQGLEILMMAPELARR